MKDQGAMARVDARVNAVFEPLRGKEPVDRVAAGLSNLSDYGLIWVLMALLKMPRKGPRRRRAIVALGAAGFSSLLVSRATKKAVERERPDLHLQAKVRAPTSSSFPSGHTTAAFCTAIVLPERTEGIAPAVGFAAAVAASRVHLRAHHPTDVIGGAVIGSVLGLALRPVVNAVAPGSGKHRSRRARRGMDPGSYVLKRL